METTIDRVLSYGAQKKSKVAENIHRIEIDPTFTYVDLSDEIASAWLMEKKANKNIEGKGHFVYGIGLAVLPEEAMLYVSLVFGNDAIGTDIKYPIKEPVVEEEVVAQQEVEENKIDTESQVEQKNEEDKDSGIETELNKEEVSTNEPEDTDKFKEADEATSSDLSDQVKTEDKTQEKEVVNHEVIAQEADPISKDSTSQGTLACLTEEKEAVLDKLTELGIYYLDSTVYIRKKYINKLTDVVTSDMDGIALIVNQLEPYIDGPNTFNYNLLKINKLYKADLFRDLESDYLVMDMPEAVEGRYAFDLRYIRKGMDCIDKNIELRTADFDETMFALAQGGGVSELDLLYDIKSRISKKAKESRQVKFILSFNRGRAKYNEKSMKAIIDKLVDPGYTISAAVVTAHTSVEGNVNLNKNLAKSRAKNIVTSLRDINGGDMFYGEVKTDDSWGHFYEAVKGTKHENLIGVDKMEAGMMITRTPSLYKELEAILKQERYAEVEVYLEYETETIDEPAFGELTNIYYDFGRWYVRKDAAKALDKFSEVLKKHSEVKLMEIGSHTDARGSYAFNEKLSQRRAESVVKYLTTKGIDKQRLIAKGYGESQLINQCKDGIKCTEMEHQRNRRTTFRVMMDSEEFSSVEPEDILVDYSPSNAPEMGYIDLSSELKAQIEQESPESALRVQRQIIKQVEAGAMKADLLLRDTIPMSSEYAPLINNQLTAKAKYASEGQEGIILKEFKDLMKLAKGNAFVVYNNLVYQLQSNQALVDQIGSSEEKKDKLLNIIDSLYKTNLPKDSLDELKAAVVNI
jgi:outer membrane protein OmpA-like peptidoglycan-associated protein